MRKRGVACGHTRRKMQLRQGLGIVRIGVAMHSQGIKLFAWGKGVLMEARENQGTPPVRGVRQSCIALLIHSSATGPRALENEEREEQQDERAKRQLTQANAGAEAASPVQPAAQRAHTPRGSALGPAQGWGAACLLTGSSAARSPASAPSSASPRLAAPCRPAAASPRTSPWCWDSSCCCCWLSRAASRAASRSSSSAPASPPRCSPPQPAPPAAQLQPQAPRPPAPPQPQAPPQGQPPGEVSACTPLTRSLMHRQVRWPQSPQAGSVG